MNILKKIIPQTKQMPQAIEVETAILSILLSYTTSAVQNDATATSDMLQPDIFYETKHKIIFKTIKELNANNIQPDIISVSEKLKEQNKLNDIGGINYLISLTNKAINTSNLDYYTLILIQYWLKREYIRLCNEMINNCYDTTTDILDLIEQFKRDTEAINNAIVSNNITTLKDACKNIYEHICKLSIDPDYQKKLLTGFTYYDKHTHGLQRGDLIVIAAESSHGKTSFATQMAIQVCQKNKEAKGLYNSLEMPKENIAARILAKATGINSKRIENEPLQQPDIVKIAEGIGELENLYFLFDDKICNNSKMIMNSIKQNVTKYNLDFVVIDYLQLIRTNNENTEKAIADICNDLKNIAINYKITIILISQLARADGKPNIKRLKYSSAIEQAADQVILIWRPDYNNANNNNIEIAEVSIAKGRTVGLANFKLLFNPELTSFDNYTGEDFSFADNNNFNNFKPF